MSEIKVWVTMPSYGSQRLLSVQMENAIIDFGKQEEARLASGMSQKEIAICQDENFHEDVCLVAIEPSSNYIILEKYAPNRKAATWTKEMNKRLSLLPVKVIQSNSDEALGIKAHVKNDLGAHHSPDLLLSKDQIREVLFA